MMIFMTKKMAQAAAKEQEKRDKLAKTTRNLTIAAITIEAVNLVRGGVSTILTLRSQQTIYDTVDKGFKSFSLSKAKAGEASEEVPAVDPNQQPPVVVDPNQQPPVVVDPKQPADQQ
jgi:hypothetical protein